MRTLDLYAGQRSVWRRRAYCGEECYGAAGIGSCAQCGQALPARRGKIGERIGETREPVRYCSRMCICRAGDHHLCRPDGRCECTQWEILRRELWRHRELLRILHRNFWGNWDHVEEDLATHAPPIRWPEDLANHLDEEGEPVLYYDVGPLDGEWQQRWARSLDPMRPGADAERERRDMVQAARSMVQCQRLRLDLERARMRLEDVDVGAAAAMDTSD
jgi:hypothetical protein